MSSTTIEQNTVVTVADDKEQNQQQQPHESTDHHSAETPESHEPDQVVDVDQEKQKQHHPHEGASSAEYRGKTDEEIDKEDQDKSNPKHIWEGQDLWLPQDGSWWYCINRPNWLNVVLVLVLILSGMFEGFLFVKVGIVNPLAIAEQFRFRVWIVMKIFLSVIGVGMFVQALFDYVSPSFFNETRASRYIMNGYIKTSIGGGLVGLGTLLAGSGPTILPAQLGANVGFSWVTALGFLAGGLLTLLLDKYWIGQYKQTVNEHKHKLTIDEKLGVRYYALAFPGSIVLIAIAFCLEFAIPGTQASDDAVDLGISPSFIWPAIAVGVWVGVNQLLFRLVAHHGEGGSTSVMVFISLFTWGNLAEKNFPNSFPRIWQFVYVWIGIPLGAVIAREVFADQADASFVQPAGFNPLRSFFGGVFSILGAKLLGNGCVCGASMTQTSEFSVEAIVQTMAMFIVGIPVAFIFAAAGVPNGPEI